MITCKNLDAKYLTEFTNGTFTATSDAPVAKGGGDQGFTPFALLEASLATCINITLRVYADTHDIKLDSVDVSVEAKPGDDSTTFEYSVTLPDTIDEKQKKRMLAAVKGCPIHGMLTKKLEFVKKD